jgi:hypothetical protein
MVSLIDKISHRMIDEDSNIIFLPSISTNENSPVDNQIPENILSNYKIPYVIVVNLIQKKNQTIVMYINQLPSDVMINSFVCTGI